MKRSSSQEITPQLCICGRPKSSHPQVSQYEKLSNDSFILEPTDIFGTIAFEKKGHVTATEKDHFALRFAHMSDTDDVDFWNNIDQLLHDVLKMERPDLVFSLYHEGNY